MPVVRAKLDAEFPRIRVHEFTAAGGSLLVITPLWVLSSWSVVESRPEAALKYVVLLSAPELSDHV